jgi:Tfp pilus assembly protein FimT
MNGFSLIQLLLVLVSLSILMIASVPAFIDLYQQYHLRTTAQHLYYVLQYAKSEAIKNNNRVYVDFQTGDNWCYGLNTNTTCDCTSTTNCTLGRYASSQSGDLNLSSSGITNHTIYFEGSHGAAEVNGTISFTLFGQTTSLSVKINRLGSLKLCSSTLSGYPSCA